MSLVSVLGASGVTGGLIARELAAQGQPFVACGRDLTRLRAAVEGLGDTVRDVRALDVHAPDTLRAALAGASVAISAIGPYSTLGAPVVDAALSSGTDLLDVSGEQGYLRWVHEQRHEPARRAGVTVLPGAGLTGAIGTLLAEVAAEAAGGDAEIHIAYTSPDRPRRASWTAGTRRSVAAMLGRPGWAYHGGELAEEPLGERRRLAWFPRPVGPRHAAAVPGVEAITVPRAAPGVRAVHTYLAMPTWKAELLQALGNAARWERFRRPLAGWLEREVPPPSAARRHAVRWACVAEARGPLGIARAWAYGRDPYATAAAFAVERGVALADAEPGVATAAAGESATHVLDGLSARSGLRWSVVRPDPDGPG